MTSWEKIKLLKKILFCSLLFSLITSCSWFDEKEEVLPGKRQAVFKFDNDVIVKSNEKIFIGDSISTEEWSQQNHNERNHLFHFKSKKSLKLKKKLKLNDIAFDKIDDVTIPVFSKEKVFFADNDYNIHSMDIESGKINWTVQLKKERKEKLPFIGGFALSESNLVITTGLGNVYLINTLSGEIIWNKNFMVQFSRPPLIKNSNIYVVSDDNQTFSLNLESGDLIWSHSGNLEEVSIIGGSKPVIHNNILIVSYSSGEIYALNASDGTLLWFDNITSGNFFNKSSLNDIQSPISIVENKVFVPTFSDKFIVYNLSDGSELWNLKLSSINPVVISGKSIYIIDTNGRLLCIDKNLGKLLWAVQLKISEKGEEIDWYGPLLTSNKLILGSSNGSALSISPFTGRLLSKMNFSEELVTNPIQIGEEIILISKDGTLFILG